MEPQGKERYYLVKEDILPEALLKTIQAKELLVRGKVKTVGEAVDQVSLSRSAYYKYKDGIHSLSQLDRENLVTLSLDLEHRSGILSRVLGMIAGREANVLTIHQSIPLQGMANAVITADISQMKGELDDLLAAVREIDGVKGSAVIGRG
ncbi:ACT domain-containing protein [Gorillibacterium timonense]|uniref:ACT domain-containing protein n=1 Tax=Gorillibacterium timonense TaxID=1689269 RepID=UPI00071E3EE3|nr:ACT domain-containing protein [Gorillibacterium timonense]